MSARRAPSFVAGVLCLSCLGSALWAAGLEADRFGAEAAFRALVAAPPAIRFRPSAPPSLLRAPAPLRLDFKDVTWPGSLTPEDRAALQTALNISGSFEGVDAWANLADNFDNQGLSLGLLSQNLGQGTLQPMLIAMRDRHGSVMRRVMGEAHLADLLGMIGRWQAACRVEKPKPVHLLDEEADSPEYQAKPSANKLSVAWAVKALYRGGRLDPAWQAELKALASTPEYVSLQLADAMDYHDRALAYQAATGVRELRAYLLMFDFVVQNGSLYPVDLRQYAAYVKSHPRATNTQRLQQLLALRLRHVKKKYVADVRSRKSAIILGAGTVHGVKRNLPVEYSYDPLSPYR